MIRVLARTIAAELGKALGLPAVASALVGIVAVSGVLGSALAASAPAGTTATDVLVQVMPFLQVGTVLVGVLVVASEYAGSQIRTTLVATPSRGLLLAGKSVATLLVLSLAGVLAVGAGLSAAAIVLVSRSRDVELGDLRLGAGAVGYLALVGLLAFAVAVLLRSLIAPLVAMLALTLIASPLLAGSTEHARWLPDRAGSLLYLPKADAILTPGTGALVLLAWIAVVGVAASASFVARDA